MIKKLIRSKPKNPVLITVPHSGNFYPDIFLIPLVAFDKNLNRLGYGGGYYDRLIKKFSQKKKL
jgi:5,10-methenyltetrahydrofolate synthetase